MSILKSSFTLKPSTSDFKKLEEGKITDRESSSPSSLLQLPHGISRLSLDGGIRINLEALSQLSFDEKTVYCHTSRCNMQDDQSSHSIQDRNFYHDEELSEEQNSDDTSISRDDIEESLRTDDTHRDDASPRKKKKIDYSYRNQRDGILSSSTAPTPKFERSHNEYASKLIQQIDNDCKKRKATYFLQNDRNKPTQRHRSPETLS